MQFKKSILSYLFKNKETDSSSVKIKDLVNNITEKLSDEEKVFLTKSNESLSLQEYKIETELERIEYLLSLIEADALKLDETVKSRLVQLKLRLLESGSLVKQALLAERKLVGESYTMQVPLKKEYTSSETTATVEDEVIFGVGFEEENVSSKVDLSTLFIRSEETTEFRIVSDTDKYPINIQFSENLYKPYNQIKIAVSSLAQTGILYVKFEKAEAISILDVNGYEIIEPYITDKVSLNIDHTTKSFSIRFTNNKKRNVSIKEMYFTEATYNKTTVFETLPLAVDKDLSFITVQTCDNYSTKDVDINYEISINGGSYRAFRPNGKLNSKKIQSIIRTSSTDASETKLTYRELENGYYKFYDENLVNINSKLRLYSEKMGEDFLSLESYYPNNISEYTVHIYAPRDFVLELSPTMSVELNGILVSYEDWNKGKVDIKEGLNTLKVSKQYWKEVVDLINYEIISINSESLTVLERSAEDAVKIEVDNYFDTSLVNYNSIYLQLMKAECKVYLKEENDVKRKFDGDYIEYFYKDNNRPLYIYSEAYQIKVETIQIKATLSTLDHKICPYISKILVRGV